MFSLEVTRYFDAAHYLRGYEGKCANLHGHSWKVKVILRGKETDKIGMLIDFVTVKAGLDSSINKYDHSCLNDIEPFTTVNPTAELLAKSIFVELNRKINKKGELESVTVYESPDCGAKFYQPE